MMFYWNIMLNCVNRLLLNTEYTIPDTFTITSFFPPYKRGKKNKKLKKKKSSLLEWKKQTFFRYLYFITLGIVDCPL